MTSDETRNITPNVISKRLFPWIKQAETPHTILLLFVTKM